MDPSYIRNFCIVAHIDHGKSTLSDRLLELTNTVKSRDMQAQLLDSNPIERERGVTIKLAPVTMKYSTYQLNLIDTPGHVDFSYEVERSLAACEGVVLLVDATAGIQAQTLAHAHKAQRLGLTIIPAINKIDLVNANVPDTLLEIEEVFGFPPNTVSHLSAKTGAGVLQLLERVIRDIPSPSGNSHQPLRALVFNSVFDQHLGVVAFVRIVDGSVDTRQELQLLSTSQRFLPKEIGVFTPARADTTGLHAGQVGYIATGRKDIRQVQVGDTISIFTSKAETTSIMPLPGYREPQPMIFAHIYPAENFDYQELVDGVNKLRLSDASLVTKPIYSPALGPGLRLGFLGLFHIEITRERLEREQEVSTVFTPPTVEYLVTTTTGKKLTIQNPNDLPDPSQIREILEPMARVTIFTPTTAIGGVMKILSERRSLYETTIYLGNRAQLIYRVPLSEVISGMFDELKSASSGFATLDYEPIEHQAVDAVKLMILVHQEPVESLARIVVRSKAEAVGRSLVEKMKDLMPPQQFATAIQAAIGGTIIARATKKAVRKDVTAKLYGGDQTRKDKLLKKQKKGKKKMARIGRVWLPEDVLTKIAMS